MFVVAMTSRMLYPIVAASFWASRFSTTNSSYYLGITADSLANSYAIGYTPSASASIDILVTKRNGDGVVVWQKQLSTVLADVGINGCVDSAGNLYVTGRTGSSYDAVVAKLSSDGQLLWNRVLAGSGTDTSVNITAAPDGNIYVACQSNSSSSTGMDILLLKYDANGVLQWQKKFGIASDESTLSLSSDSTGVYVVAAGVYSATYSISTGHLLKVDFAGNILWQRMGGSTWYGVASDATGVYVTGWLPTNSFDVCVAKYSLDGVLQWQRKLGGSGQDIVCNMAVDSSGVYIAGYQKSQPVASTNDTMIAKYDQSGVIQWQRVLSSSVITNLDLARSIALDSTGFYLSGDNFAARLPKDGTKTGTYGEWTYRATTLTESAGSISETAGNLVAIASALPESAGSLQLLDNAVAYNLQTIS